MSAVFSDSMYFYNSMPVSAPALPLLFTAAMTPESLQVNSPQLSRPATPASMPASPLSTTKRVRHKSSTQPNKRAINSFLLYRQQFPARYPHIDKLERHQGPKSAIIGAMWRNETPDVQEYFFELQHQHDEEWRLSRGQLPVSKDQLKIQMRRERARERRARDDKLGPRGELILNLWKQGVHPEELVQRVRDFDARQAHKEPAPAKPFGNSTNKQLRVTPSSPCYSLAPSPASTLESLPISTPQSSPMSLPAPLCASPEPVEHAQAQLQQPIFMHDVVPNIADTKQGDWTGLVPLLTLNDWTPPVQNDLFLSYETPLGDIMSGAAFDANAVFDFGLPIGAQSGMQPVEMEESGFEPTFTLDAEHFGFYDNTLGAF